MIVEFDTKKRHPTRIKDKNGKWHIVCGKCLRCGKCCPKDCEHLTHEVVDNISIAMCRVQFSKPFLCALYPVDPDKPLKEGCGFRWE